MTDGGSCARITSMRWTPPPSPARVLPSGSASGDLRPPRELSDEISQRDLPDERLTGEILATRRPKTLHILVADELLPADAAHQQPRPSREKTLRADANRFAIPIDERTSELQNVHRSLERRQPRDVDGVVGTEKHRLVAAPGLLCHAVVADLQREKQRPRCSGGIEGGGEPCRPLIGRPRDGESHLLLAVAEHAFIGGGAIAVGSRLTAEHYVR